MLQKYLSKQGFNLTATTLLLSFVFVMLLGLNLSMMMSNNGVMSHCPFMDGSMSLCPMNAAEHINEWNAAFTAIPQNHLMQILLSAVGFVFIAFALNNLFLVFRNVFIVRYRRYQTDHPHIPLFNYFILVLAQGIIQPKLYV
jgi:hypothetical protein